MARAATAKQPRAEASAAARTILENLVWDRNSPEAERALAIDEATRVLHHEVSDRVGILRVVAALRYSPLAALAELQRLEPWASSEAGMVDLGLFEAHVTGAASGGATGIYGQAFLATLAAAGPYVSNLH